LQPLTEQGPGAFAAEPERPPPVEEKLAPGTAATLYLREISQIPLLNAAEEVALAQQLEAGTLAKQQLAGERPGVEGEKVREAFRVVRVPISLDTLLSEANEGTITDLIADAGAR
jgi:DNA-directed RNA polymerase sigma subunit (sigma70/sigma32)